MPEYECTPSPLRLYNGEDWRVLADIPRDADGYPDRDAPPPHATLRRIGWIDQKGRIWLAVPPAEGFNGGSLTPLLIDARDD